MGEFPAANQEQALGRDGQDPAPTAPTAADTRVYI